MCVAKKQKKNLICRRYVRALVPNCILYYIYGMQHISVATLIEKMSLLFTHFFFVFVCSSAIAAATATLPQLLR